MELDFIFLKAEEGWQVEEFAYGILFKMGLMKIYLVGRQVRYLAYGTFQKELSIFLKAKVGWQVEGLAYGIFFLWDL